MGSEGPHSFSARASACWIAATAVLTTLFISHHLLFVSRY